MAEIYFYEKPGCVNNTRQKRLLTQSGHRVVSRDLLHEAWTEDRLRAFFKDMPVALWFNRSAPEVKSGTIVPEKCDEKSALKYMLNDPLLIRRPLMQSNNETMVGFDYMRVNEWIGLIQTYVDEAMEQCVRNESKQ